MDKVVKDLNNTLISQLNELFGQYEKNFSKFEKAISEISNVLSDNLDYYNELIANNLNYEVLREEFNNLRKEVEELKIAIIDNPEIKEWKEPLLFWHILVAQEAMPLQNAMELISA